MQEDRRLRISKNWKSFRNDPCPHLEVERLASTTGENEYGCPVCGAKLSLSELNVLELERRDAAPNHSRQIAGAQDPKKAI